MTFSVPPTRVRWAVLTAKTTNQVHGNKFSPVNANLLMYLCNRDYLITETQSLTPPEQEQPFNRKKP